MAQAAAMTLGLKVSDVSGQKAVRATAVPLSSTIGELVQGLLAKMGLARNDAQGRPLHYYARLEREGRHLNGSELVGDALENDDELTLAPNVEAGATPRCGTFRAPRLPGGRGAIRRFGPICPIRQLQRTQHMTSDYTYTIDLHRDDGSILSQKAVEPEWGAALEWVYFEGIRAGRLPPTLAANLAAGDYRVDPVWDPVAGQPRVSAFRVAVPANGHGEVARDIPTAYLRDLVQQESAALVQKGELERGDTYRYNVSAFAHSGQRSAEAGIEIAVEQMPQPLPLRPASLERFLTGAVDNESEPNRGDFPVFIPAAVLEEARELARQAGDVETGGVLVGFLHHDADVPEVFVEITAQIAATHTQAESAKLTFTPETWAAVRTALALRNRGETMAGWWHYHPDFCRLRNCPPESRIRCLASSAFFSADDVALHAALFGRAFNTALLISDSTADGLTTSLFGWRQGMVQSRGFYATERSSADGARHTND